MASERDRAKRAIQGTEDREQKLDDALAGAHDLQHRIAVENNRHKEAMRAADLGWFGRAFGGESNAPMAIALICVGSGILGFFGAAVMAATSQRAEGTELWSKWAERSLVFASTALSYIFGRGSNRR